MIKFFVLNIIFYLIFSSFLLFYYFLTSIIIAYPPGMVFQEFIHYLLRLIIGVFLIYGFSQKLSIAYYGQYLFSIATLMTAFLLFFDAAPTPIITALVSGIPAPFLVLWSAYQVFIIVLLKDATVMDEFIPIEQYINEVYQSAYPNQKPKEWFLESTPVKIFNNGESQELMENEELNRELRYLAGQIKQMLEKILPHLEVNDLVDINTARFFREHSWDESIIILNFKKRAIDSCEDYRDIEECATESVQRVVYESELLKVTKTLMNEWIQENGQDVSFLIHIN
jgi:hypothetical protein